MTATMTRPEPTTTQMAERPETNQSPARRETYVVPAVDLYETDESFVIVADVPGIDPATIQVSAEKNVLTIKASPPAPDVDRRLVWREFEPVGYARQFQLGNRVDQTRINAEFKHGVLTVTLPLVPHATPRQIEVKVS